MFCARAGAGCSPSAAAEASPQQPEQAPVTGPQRQREAGSEEDMEEDSDIDVEESFEVGCSFLAFPMNHIYVLTLARCTWRKLCTQCCVRLIDISPESAVSGILCRLCIIILHVVYNICYTCESFVSFLANNAPIRPYYKQAHFTL